MKLFLKVWIPIAATLLSALARADWIEDSDVYAREVLEAQGTFAPEYVSQHGMTQFDSEVVDLNPEVFERYLAVSSKLQSKLRKSLEGEKNNKVRQDLEILLQSLADGDESQILARKHLIPFFNIHKRLFRSFNALLDPRNENARYPNALVRLKKYVGAEQGFSPITELAVARTQERFEVEGLVGPYRGELETELENAEQYVVGIRSVFERSELEGWQDNFALLESQLAEYKTWLREVLLPRTRPENQLPIAIYADNLKNYGVRATPEELIKDALFNYQFIRSEMKALAWQIAQDRGWDDKSLVSVLRELKKEQIPQGKILQVYQQRLATIEAIIRREDLISLPERDANIRLATAAESAATPAPFMSPPQLINNTGQFGEFVLVQSNPAATGDAVMDDWSHYAITWALAVHEARPGHELQFASLVENGTSLARAIFARNSANSEGWGLYAESIMHEFMPPEAQLFNLYTRLMRAARMFMDPMVNTGKMTHGQAIRFMTEQLALSPAMAGSEADRYAFWAPGQATSYFYGYMNLMRLRTELEIALGDQFDQRQFHDTVLKQGILPPDLLREAVLNEFIK
ncbi:MAG: DUF885 domain-containing protein [Halioglobus sp.]